MFEWALAPEAHRWPSAAEAAVLEASLSARFKTVPLQQLKMRFATASSLLSVQYLAAIPISCARAVLFPFSPRLPKCA